jgi:WD40 repeat protein/serine/threonine protein kinase
MALTVDQFAGAVVSSGLMEADEIKTLWNSLPAETRPKSGEELARLLISRETITRFQAQEVIAGRGALLQIGQYLLVDRIGAGGMGHVYRARHRLMKRTVAIKVLSPDRVKNEESVRRFDREVELAARLSHPNIVQAYDSGAMNGRHFLVMEFIDGLDLSSLVKQQGPRPVDEAVKCLKQAAEGLAFAHTQGVIHRDLKPSNLLVDKTGTVKISDFGLATLGETEGSGQAELTVAGQVMGTTDYMAPEQAVNMRQADARSDIYSLGCTLYRVLANETPYGGETVVEKLLAHREKPIPSLREKRPDVPEALEAIYQKMMAKKPEDRYQRADELAAALGTVHHSAGGKSSIHDHKLSSLLREMSHAGASPSTSGVLSKSSSSIGSGSSSITLGASSASGTRLGSSLSGRTMSGSKKLARADQTVASGAMPSATLPVALPVAVPLEPRADVEPEPDAEDESPPWWRSRAMMIAAASVPIILFAAAVAYIINRGGNEDVAQPGIKTTDEESHEGLQAAGGAYVPLPPLSGVVATPQKLPGVERWQIETVIPRGVSISTIAWSPDQKLLACGTGNYVRLYDVNTWQLLRFLGGHSSAVTALAWSPDGERLCSSSRDGVVRIWNWDGTMGPIIAQQSGTGYRVAWSPDGKWIATGGDDKTVRLFKPDGTAGPVMSGHTNVISCLDFSPDSRQLVSGSEDNTLRIWTIDGQFKKELKGHQKKVSCVSWGKEKLIASGSRDEGKVRLWYDIGAQGPVINTPVHCLDWSPDGLQLGIGWNGKFQTFRGNGQVDPDSQQKWPSINAVAWSADGRRIAWGSEGILAISNPDGEGRSVIGYSTAANSVRVSADGSTIASAHDDGTVRFWTRDGKPGAVVQAVGENVRVNSVAWNPTAKQLATVTTDGFVRLYTPDGKLGTTIDVSKKASGAVAWSPDGKQLVVRGSGDPVLHIYNLDGKRAAELKGHVKGVLGVDWGRGGWIASCSEDATIHLWKPNGERGPMFSTGHGVDRVKWRPDGQVLVADVRSVGYKQFNASGPTGVSTGASSTFIAWSPDGLQVVKSGTNATPTISGADGKSPVGLTGHAGTQCLDWSSDNRIVVGCSDSTIRAWDAATRKILWVAVALGNGESALFTPEGQMIAGATNIDKSLVWLAGSASGQIDVYKQKDFQKLIDKATAEAKKTVERDRRAAEWIRKLGGTVKVIEFGKPLVEIKGTATLPTGPFWLVSVSLTGKKNFKETDISNLQGLGELEDLYLNDGALGDDAIEQLTDLPKLRKLHLHGLEVTDEGLKYLLQLPSVVDLNLNNTSLGDPAVKFLSAMPRLTYLQLKNTKLTQAGFDKLQAALPKCKIDWTPPQ